MNKIKAVLFYLSFIFLIVSCQKDPSVTPTTNDPIRGKWNFKYVYSTEYKISNNQVLSRDTLYVPSLWPNSFFDFKTSEKMYAYIDGSNEVWDYKILPNNKIEFIDYPGGGGKDTFDIVKLQSDILIMKDYNTNNTDPTIREENLFYCEK
jgi:hypothetical protein